MGNCCRDLRHNGGMPSQTDRDAFTVGTDLAITPGAVVHRDEVIELIQYTPTTEHGARSGRCVIVPPPIGRFYFLDLRPGPQLRRVRRVSQGLQVFMISWRNPTQEQADWDLDTYAARVSSAIDAVARDHRRRDVNVIGFCAGGIITTTLLNHLAATGDDRVHSRPTR